MEQITTVNELMKILENGDYNYYGLRAATEHDVEVMDRGYLDCSYDTFNDADVSDADLLNGTSAIGVDEYMDENEIIARYDYTRKTYLGSKILLVADKCSEYGSDDNEIILGSNGYGADVIAEVKF